MNHESITKILESSSNCRVPTYYISGLQWSRLFALVYLDDNLRNDKQFGQIYKKAMVDFLEHKKKMALLTRGEAGSMEVGCNLFFISMFGDDGAYEKFKSEIPNVDFFLQRFYRTLDHLQPGQSFRFALEENPFWGANNGLFYLLAIHRFYQDHNPPGLKNNVYEVVNGNTRVRVELLEVILRNMMFYKTVKIDPPPDVMNGYGISTLENMVNDKVTGLTLPANATCC